MTSSAAHIQSDAAPGSELYNPIKGNPFNPTPRSVQRRTDLSLGARAVYGYLCGCFGKDGLVHPKLETIAKEAGLSSKRQASRCVTELKEAGLIAIIRTGRASYYRFLNPDTEKIKKEIKSDTQDVKGHGAHSEGAKESTLEPVTPIIENNSSKKQPPARVVVLPDNDLVQKAFDTVPEKYQTPNIKRTLKAGLAANNNDGEYILKAIEYTNSRSSTSYSGYLSGAIKGNWAEDWTPPEVIKERSFKKMAETQAKLEQEKKEAEAALEHRAALAEKWLNLPEAERKEIRDKYVSGCSKFEAKKARYLKNDRLALSPGFRFFLEKIEAN